MEAKERKNIFSRIMNLTERHNILLTLILVCMVLLFTLINPNFIQTYNLLSMAQTLVPYAILTIGVMFVIASGNTDLSLGALCIAAAVMAGKLYLLGMPLWCVIPVMIVIGTLFGALNGWLVAKMKIPSFIATLGTMMFSRGFSAILVSDPNIFYPNGTWFNKVFSNFNGFPSGIIWLILFTIIALYLVYKSKTGRYILAIGSNSEAARLSGIKTEKYVFIAYLISGISAGLAGIFWASSFATVASATGNGMEFDAIAAVFIGGTGAAGGSASVTGSVLGMIMLVIIRSGLNFVLAKFNIAVNSTYVTYVMTGIIIVSAIMIDTLKKKNFKKIKNVQMALNSSKKKRIIAASVAAVIIIAAVAGTTFINNKNNISDKKIAVVSKLESSSFWTSIKQGCINGGDAYGYEVLYRGPEGESAAYLPKALDLIQTAISNKPVALAVAALCPGYADVLELAYDAGIPVVEYDSGVFQSDKDALDAKGKNPIVCSVSIDSYSAGGLCAEKIFAKVKSDIKAKSGEYLVGVIQHEVSKTAEDRANGFIDRFKALADADPELKNKVRFATEVKPDATNNNYKLALEALAEKNADLIFASNLVVAENIFDAIVASENRYDNIKFATFDCGTKPIEWLRREGGPVLLGGVAQDTLKIGYTITETCVKVAEGMPYEKNVSVDCLWYDEGNLDELIESGAISEG